MTAKQPVLVVFLLLLFKLLLHEIGNSLMIFIFFLKIWLNFLNMHFELIYSTDINNLLKIKIERERKIDIKLKLINFTKILFNSHLCKLSRRYSPTPPEPSTTTLNSLMLSSCIFFFVLLSDVLSKLLKN